VVDAMRMPTEVTLLDLTPAAMQVRREQAFEKRARANRAFLHFLLVMVLALAAIFVVLRLPL
jgi:hypothetical protein